jgi:hypothetical protein
MKNIHFLGFILWLLASFFAFKLVILLYKWFGDIGLTFKIIIIIITAVIIMLGFYKIFLSFFLLVNKNHEKFNLISTIFSAIGLIGLIASYIHFGFNYTFDKSEMFSQSLSFTFGLFLAIILINGFVFFPRSLTKIKNRK